MFKIVLFFCVIVLFENEAAKILAYYPTPSISHQVVFRPLSLELAKRGHEITVITTDPMFPEGDGPINLTEIDVHDLSYTIWEEALTRYKDSDENIHHMVVKLMLKLVEEQIKTSQVQQLLADKSKSFDLVIVEAFVEPALGISYYYKAPVIQFSSLSIGDNQFKIYGTPTHPLLYTGPIHERVYNLTVMEKLNELYVEYQFGKVIPDNMVSYNSYLRRVFGPDAPLFEDLRSNVDMLFLNVYPVWDFNRPVPTNVVYLGGLHQKPQKDLPKVLKLSYLS